MSSQGPLRKTKLKSTMKFLESEQIQELCKYSLINSLNYKPWSQFYVCHTGKKKYFKRKECSLEQRRKSSFKYVRFFQVDIK